MAIFIVGVVLSSFGSELLAVSLAGLLRQLKEKTNKKREKNQVKLASRQKESG